MTGERAKAGNGGLATTNTQPLPAGAIGMTVANEDASWISRAIARRQAVPYSHAVISLGNGQVLDQTWPRTRIRSEREWREARPLHWWCPTIPFGTEEVRKLRAIADFCEGRIPYSWRSILSFLFRGRGSEVRAHGLYCTQFVAEIYLVVRDVDFSGIGQPWQVDVRSMLGRLGDERDFLLVPDEGVRR